MKKCKVFVLLFLVLNLAVTYLLTTSLNPNIVPFKTNLIGEVSSVIGNFAFCLLILSIGFLFIKREKSLYRYLIIVTFFLNLVILLLSYFTRSFKTQLSFHNLSLFYNPDAGFAKQMVIDGLTGVITDYQFLCLIPFVLLLVLYLFMKVDKKNIVKISIKSTICLLILSLSLSYLSFFFFIRKLDNEYPFRSDIAQLGAQNCGIYNYYFFELVLGFDYNEKYHEDIKNTGDELVTFDRKEQSENLSILAGSNLFVIQAESLQTFALSYKFNGNLLMPKMNELLLDGDVFYFSNVYSNVGLGNTSDAEFIVNTGFYPLGDLTISWKVQDNLFDIQTLPKLFGLGYVSNSYNPTIEGFYDHKYVHENFYQFNCFKGYESFNKSYSYSQHKEYYYQEKWVSDKAILDYALSDCKSILENEKNFYVFTQTISPHYPFMDLSQAQNHENINFNLGNKFNNYLNQINYLDKVLFDFILKAKDELDNTLFIIYGDHGTTLPKKSYEKLLGRSISDIEYRKLLLEIPVIIYDPSGKINNYITDNNLETEKIFNRTLSQIDIFSTIVSLYDLNPQYLLGVDMFSYEKSFTFEPKNLDLLTDKFFYSFKNNDYEIYGNYDYCLLMEEKEYIKNLILANNHYLTMKVFGS